jgi:thymidylate synthase (FAD)
VKVRLLTHTPDPERAVASAAKLCYAAVGVDQIFETMSDEDVQKFLGRLIELGHGSPFEHASFTFAIEGVSRVLTHQLVRHRIASYSQQSQRYVKLEQFEYIVPPNIAANPKAAAIFEETMKRDQEAYNAIVDAIEAPIAEKLISEGKNEKVAWQTAEKTAIEDARFVFPNACETKIVVTMNARALHNFFEHRCCNRAQWEIRALAVAMLTEVRKLAPTLFKYAGPKCLHGPCPEGKMTCGKIKAVRAFYEQLSVVETEKEKDV